MIHRFFATPREVSLLILRLAAGLVLLPHGAQKTLGWFGGPGFSVAMGSFAHMHVPGIFAFLAIAAESAGALGLILGLFTRLAALGAAVEMAVAVLMVHLPNGFFMNWSGQQKGEGFEFHILLIGICLALLLKGGGAYSLDRLLAGHPRDGEEADGAPQPHWKGLTIV